MGLFLCSYFCALGSAFASSASNYLPESVPLIPSFLLVSSSRPPLFSFPAVRIVSSISTAYHSSSPHKEFRFLLPVLPIAHAYAGRAVSALVQCARPATKSSPAQRRRRSRSAAVAVGLFFLHVPAAIYLSVWHQSGALSAVDALARRIPALVAPKLADSTAASACLGVRPGGGEKRELVTVHFLMPCHSAPLHSHLHFRGSEGGLWSGKASLWSLDCSPK